MLESTIKVDDELALKCLQDIIGKMEIIDVLSTSNMYLNYLINSKVEKIKSLNIDLIDNAIEAQKYVENKRFIKLSTIKKADRVRLIIENSCNIEEIHMDNQKLITSKEDKENHGIGFNRVCEVVKEKNGIITRTVNHKIFTVEIVLPIES